MSEAKIYSQGYTTYDGPRTGLMGAVKSLQKQSLRQALGMGRSARHKVIPVLVILIAYVPVIIFVGVAVLAKIAGDVFLELAQELIPSYADFYNIINFAIVALSAFIIPDLLCSDRRNGMLGVYLASTLDRLRYILGKAWASLVILFTVIFGPPFLLLIALSLQNLGPENFSEWIETFGKIIVASTVIGIFYVLIALAISSFTDRKSIATISFLALVLGSSIISGIFESVDLSSKFRLMNLYSLSLRLAQRIFGEEGGWGYFENSTTSIWLAWGVVVSLCVGLIWFQYRRMLVQR